MIESESKQIFRWIRTNKLSKLFICFRLTPIEKSIEEKMEIAVILDYV